MESHQRYFPVQRADGSLDNRFIVAHNGSPERTEAIVRGHERVIRARLSDAAFFYKEDLAHPIESFVEQLDTIVFQDKLGSLGDKVRRTERLAARIARHMVTPAPTETAYAERAAHLAKADLVIGSGGRVHRPAGRHGRLLRSCGWGGARGRRRDRRPLPASFRGRRAPAFACGQHRRNRRQARHHRRHLLGRHGSHRLGGPVRAAAQRHRRAADAARRAAASRSTSSSATRSRAIRVSWTSTSKSPEPPSRSSSSGGWRGSCATAATPTTPSTPCSPWPPTIPPTRWPGATRSRRFARRAATWRTCRWPSPGPRTSHAPSLGSRSTRRSWDRRSWRCRRPWTVPRATLAELAAARAYSAQLEVLAGLRVPIDAFFEGVMVMADDPAVRDNRLKLLNRFVAMFGTIRGLQSARGMTRKARA